jgi:hypothetical protein
MSLSRREAILAALAARLSADREPARTDMGEALGTYLDDQGESSQLEDYEVERHVLTVRAESVHTITVIGTGEDAVTETRATAANRMLAALRATANGSDRSLGGLCDDIVYTGGGPLLLEDPTRYVGAYASFEVTYTTPVGDPYLPEPEDPDPDPEPDPEPDPDPE